MICDILYIITSQKNIISYNANSMTSQLIVTSSKLPANSQYNPRDRILFGWKNKQPVYYFINFNEFESKTGKFWLICEKKLKTIFTQFF